MSHEVGHAERLGIHVAPLLTQSPALLPTVIPTPRSSMEVAKAAVQRSTDAFELVASGRDLHATNKAAAWATRHEGLLAVLGVGSAGVGVLCVGAAIYQGQFTPLLGLVPAVVGFLATSFMDFLRTDLQTLAGNRVLDSGNVEPILAALRDSTPEERALVRLFVEQKTTELEKAERLTPAAALALRQSIKGAVANQDELDRVGTVAAFVAKHKTVAVSDHDLYALNGVLYAATEGERIAAADYIDSSLFPHERPLSHLGPEQARKLFAALAYFRGHDVPCPPTGPEPAKSTAAA